MISLNHWCQLGRVQFCGISSQCDLDSLSEQFHWNWSYQVLVLQLVISKFWFPSGAIVLQWIYCNTHSLWLEHCTWISLEILCTNREPDSTDIVTKGRFRSVGLLKVDMILPWQFWFLLDQSLKVSTRNSVFVSCIVSELDLLRRSKHGKVIGLYLKKRWVLEPRHRWDQQGQKRGGRI